MRGRAPDPAVCLPPASVRASAAFRSGTSGSSTRAIWRGDPVRQPRLHGVAQLALQQIVGDQLDHGRQRMRSGRKFADHRARPPELAVLAQVDGVVARGDERARAR